MATRSKLGKVNGRTTVLFTKLVFKEPADVLLLCKVKTPELPLFRVATVAKLAEGTDWVGNSPTELTWLKLDP